MLNPKAEPRTRVLGFAFFLNYLPDQFSAIGAIEPLKLLDAGGGREVNFCQIIADNIDSNKNLTFLT